MTKRKKPNNYPVKFAEYGALVFVFYENKGKVESIKIRKRKDGEFIRRDDFYQQKIEEYFNSKKDFLELPYNITGLSGFTENIVRNLRKIKRGETVSYSEFAILCGLKSKYARAVGQALKRNPLPLVFPCHRVIRSNGQIGGFAGKNSSIKNELLEMENKKWSW